MMQWPIPRVQLPSPTIPWVKALQRIPSSHFSINWIRLSSKEDMCMVGTGLATVLTATALYLSLPSCFPPDDSAHHLSNRRHQHTIALNQPVPQYITQLVMCLLIVGQNKLLHQFLYSNIERGKAKA